MGAAAGAKLIVIDIAKTAGINLCFTPPLMRTFTGLYAEYLKSYRSVWINSRYLKRNP